MPKSRNTGMDKRLETLAVETEKQKKEIVSQLRKTPIVQLACERTGVGRSTYYKWRANDRIFARAADDALEAGRFFINDLAESKLMKLIQEDNMTAIIFWLKHNHPKYAVVNRIIHEYEVATEKMSVEEERIGLANLSRAIAIKYAPQLTAEEMKTMHEEDEGEPDTNAEIEARFEKGE